MPHSFVKSILLCEDLRQEMSGREFAIGILTGGMLLQKVPVTLPQLTIRLELNFSGEEKRKFNFRFLDPYEGALFSNQIDVEFANWNRPGVVAAKLQNFYFPIVGKYKLQIQFDEGWITIYELFVDIFEPSTAIAQMEENLKAFKARGGSVG